MELPPGLTIIENVISDETESRLIDHINSSEWNTSLKRLTQHYGYKYDYSSKVPLEKVGELPEWIVDVKSQLTNALDLDKNLNQAIINRYLPGEGISAHIDHTKLFGDTVVGLSLGSDAQMLFTQGLKSFNILLPRKSVICMTGESRYRYTHEIKARKSDLIDGKRVKRGTRYSITFRETQSQ